MKIKLLGKNLDDIRPLLQRMGMEETDGEASLVVAHGGDGTLLAAERMFPGIPKLPLRDTGTAPVCEIHGYEKRLNDYLEGRAKRSELRKIEALFEGRRLLGLNDVFLHNEIRANALRYRVHIDNELYANEVVGDAVGLASVHGSTAYYRSITHSIFRTGIGLAFSNSTEEVNHLVLNKHSVVTVTVMRGPGLLMADNSPEVLTVCEGGIVRLRLSEERAVVFGLADFMCPRCRVLRHPNKLPFQTYLPLGEAGKEGASC